MVTIDSISIMYRSGSWKKDTSARRKLVAAIRRRLSTNDVYTPECVGRLLTDWLDEVWEDDLL